MEMLITNGIRVSVQPQYQPAYSRPVLGQYVFSYHIVIENCSDQTVQLLYRHWIITDGIGFTREVEGEGVIGLQPVLEAGAVHAYDSWCPLPTPLGFMEGRYLMARTDNNERFYVDIPRFRMEAIELLN
ncbi:MAG: Co2+/Mg2+ efflux protein ApaG [Saprospiraceae bacterium]